MLDFVFQGYRYTDVGAFRGFRPDLTIDGIGIYFQPPPLFVRLPDRFVLRYAFRDVRGLHEDELRAPEVV